MADWVTISSLATGGGTLALAAATFGSVRSANRAARTAERALQVGLRAVLVPSRPEAPAEKIMWVDRHWARVGGGQAVVESVSGVVYLALAVRNVGPGLAVIDGWHVRPGLPTNEIPPAEPDAFSPQTRDLYIPSGDSGFWQGAVRDAEDPYRAIVERAVAAREAFTIEVLYGDHEGGQRTVTRFAVLPREDDGWLGTAGRHWSLDGHDPR